MYVCMCMYVYVCVCMYVCMYVYICIYMYMYMYHMCIYIYIFWNEFKCDLFFYNLFLHFMTSSFRFFFFMLSQHNIVTVIQLTFCNDNGSHPLHEGFTIIMLL